MNIHSPISLHNTHNLGWGGGGACYPTQFSCDLNVIVATKVFVGDAEACHTKVMPMTLSPVWDETFVLSLNSGGNGVDGGGGSGLRLELWDHSVHGDGEYLGTSIAVLGFRKREILKPGFDACYGRGMRTHRNVDEVPQLRSSLSHPKRLTNVTNQGEQMPWPTTGVIRRHIVENTLMAFQR